MVNLIYEQLQDNIREGKKVDKPLTNWFLLTFVLSWLTLGIALVYTFIKRILRVDKYIRRKSEYFDIVIHFIEVESNERGLDDYENIMNRLKTRLQEFKNNAPYIMPYFIKAFIPLIIFTIFLALFVLLTGIGNIENYLLIVIFSVWAVFAFGVIIVYIYKMNKVWDDIQKFEHDMYEDISRAFISLKLIEHPIMYYMDLSIKKEFVKYTILGFVTCGIWFLVWDYYVHTAPDNMYKIFHGAENKVSEIIKSCCRRD